MKSKFFIEVKINLDYLSKKITDDNYLNNLLYANIITIMESYLYKTFIFLLEKESILLNKLADSSKFKSQKVPLKLALGNIKNHILTMIKGINYHNLADIELIYKEILDVNIKYNDKVLNAINKRHDIIHRNGYNKNSEKIIISKEEVIETIKIFENFIGNIDIQIIEQFSKIKGLK